MFFIFVGIVFFVFIFSKIRDLKKNPLNEKGKKVKATIILVTLFLLACMFILAGIGQYASEKYAKTSDENTSEINDIDESWENDFSSEQLQWSKRSAKEMNWNDAVNYCKTLSEENHNDWKLPTIGELRTLIQNCPKTEIEGSCKIGRKSCLSYACFEKLSGNCFCEYKDKNSGFYSKLGDDANIWLWSASILSESEYANYRWYVSFTDGGVWNYRANADNLYVRCVRTK